MPPALYPVSGGLWFSAALFIGLVAVPPRSHAQSQAVQVSGDTMESLLDKTLQAYTAGDFAAAAAFIQQLSRDFGNEPAFREKNFRRRLLPLQGHAELAAGQPSAAAETLRRFVDEFPDDPEAPGALLSLGIALGKINLTDEAVARFRQLQEHHRDRPEAGLSLLEQCRLLVNRGETATAVDELETFARGTAPTVLRDRAVLSATHHLLEKHQAANDGQDQESRVFLTRAAELFLEHPWEIDAMPEVATLTFLAMDLGDRLLETDPSASLRAYRLALPRELLLPAQAAQIEEIIRRLQQPPRPSERFWHQFYRGMLDRMRTRAETIAANPDYTPALYLRRGQALLLAGRPHEAWLIFEQLALDGSLSPDIRETAHYRWTVAARALERWEEALTIARNFLARYLEADLAPQTLHLIAQAHQEQRRYSEAAAIFEDLLTRFPDHALAQRWRFTLGFNRAVNEEYPAARAAFHSAASDFPEGNLTANAELWHALTFFFERDYSSALAELDELVERYKNHLLTGEILYRRAATLYAMRDYERAEQAAGDFVKTFGRHQRQPEALVLFGDILMGGGKLDQARTAFESIPPENSRMFVYGLFQRGKILRARQDYKGMIDLFSEYVDAPTGEKALRLSEALYWIGWAHAQLDQPEKATRLILRTLDAHGNDPDSGEILSILALLEKLGIHHAGTRLQFSDWLEERRSTALSAKEPVLFSRLTLHLAEIKRRRGLPHQADELLFSIVNKTPVNELGPEALGSVGHFLLEKELGIAKTWFETLLENYPGSPDRAFAFHGLGTLSYSDKNYETALRWLRRFERETAAHPLLGDVLLLSGKSLAALERFDEAVAKFDTILELRSQRGRMHARALIELAKTMEAAGEPDRAIAYCQRVYTLHRAQPDLTADAYLRSSALFEQRGDLQAAHRTLVEMLSLPELAETGALARAQTAEQALAERIQPESGLP